MYSYADSFEQPISERFKDESVTISLLTQRDYMPWLAELTADRQDKARKNAPPLGKTKERSDWMAMVDNMELTPADLQPLLFRVSGTLKVLGLALRKIGWDEAKVNEFIDSRPAKANEILAVRVSGLFRREEIESIYPTHEKKKAEDSDPNAGKGSQQQSDSDQTGQQ